MLTLIDNARDLFKYQQEFHKKMIAAQSKLSFEVDMNDSPMDGTRFWNGFWINGKIICEINIPATGINSRVAATFAEDEKRNVYLIHRGSKLHKIKKEFFFKHYKGEFKTISMGKKEHHFALVGELNSKEFPLQVQKFILEIKRIKTLAGI